MLSKNDKLKRMFTYANILSLSRIFMAIPLVMSLDKGWFDESIRYQICFWILLAIFLSDVLDGPLARWTDQVTNIGKIIDPLADKICMMVVLLYLIKEYGELFFIFFLLISIRDTFLIIVGVYLLQFKEDAFEAIASGKIFMFSSVVMIISYIFPCPNVIRLTLYLISILLFVISSLFYFKNYRLTFRRLKNARHI